MHIARIEEYKKPLLLHMQEYKYAIYIPRTHQTVRGAIYTAWFAREAIHTRTWHMYIYKYIYI